MTHEEIVKLLQDLNDNIAAIGQPDSSEKIVIAVVGVVFLAMQLIITVINRKWTSEIITKLSDNAFESEDNVNKIKKHFDGEHGKQDTQIDVIKEKVTDIHSTITQKDSDGSPLIYVPRSWIKIQEQIASTCADTAKICSDTALTQKSMLKILDKIDLRQTQRRQEHGN